MYMSSKDRVRWWSQKLKKRYNINYVTMNKLKKLAILEKVVRNNLDEIEEIDIYRIQKIDTAKA